MTAALIFGRLTRSNLLVCHIGIRASTNSQFRCERWVLTKTGGGVGLPVLALCGSRLGVISSAGPVPLALNLALLVGREGLLALCIERGVLGNKIDALLVQIDRARGTSLAARNHNLRPLCGA